MNKLLIAVVLLFVVSFSEAQKVKVLESTESVEGVSRSGMYVLLELDKTETEKAWNNYLKKYGKPSSKNGIITVLAANMKAIHDYPCVVYSKVEVAHTGARVWWAIDLGSKMVTKETEAEYRGAEKMLYEFSVSAYRDDITKQIADAETALESATKIHQKKVKENANLLSKIEKNKARKTELENKLKVNVEDHARLHREIDNNLAEQKIAIQNVEAIKATQNNAEAVIQTKEEKNALNDASKVAQKKSAQGQKLTAALEKNKAEKIKLEANLKANASESVELAKKQEQNTLDMDAAAKDVEKMKKATEVVKEKMNKLE